VKFLWTTIRVSNLERSLGFYQEIVGLPVRNRMAHPGMELVFLGEGETALELIHEAGLGKVDLGAHVSLGFQVSDLDASMAHMKAQGIQITGGPIKAGPTTRFFFVKDPDGMNIQFVEER